eukprot:CAMPEP_0197027372 /NCGR_PEP_ID=MMETSP1384-20130603/7289_1 /TAXON_ID=29189 /ORGANISM="Ammonia sp." /LENGTH=456 /DNA_ID=CAMNT_0042456207 /DNA_START=48 /DNA_END=1415 /DNA_ORIENTATION=+
MATLRRSAKPTEESESMESSLVLDSSDANDRGYVINDWCADDEHSDYESCSGYSFISNSSSDFFSSDDEFAHRDNTELQYSLKIKEQLVATPAHIVRCALHRIADSVFHGASNVIDILLKTANHQQLAQMHEILDQENQAKMDTLSHPYCRETNTAPFIETADETDSEHESLSPLPPTPATTHFNQLSTASITHICGYLERKDIKSFKLTSTRLGVICLNEMTKHSIGVFNMNDLLHPHFRCVFSGNFDLQQCIKFSRHNANKDLLYLQQAWCRQYEIPFEHQLVFPYDKKRRDDTIVKILSSTFCKFFQSHQLDTKIHDFSNIGGQRRYLLFDKRHMIKLADTGECAKMSSSDQLDGEHHLIVLRYHDANGEADGGSHSVQYLMAHNSTTYRRVLDYVQTQFIATNEHQANWYKTLLRQINGNQTGDERKLRAQYRVCDRVGLTLYGKNKTPVVW